MKWPFLGGAYTGRSLNANASTCVNFFIEPASKGQDAMLVPTPGYSLLSTSNVGTALAIRGILYPGSGNLVYCVQGNRLVSFNVVTLAWTMLATFNMTTTTGPVSMAINTLVASAGSITICDGVKVHTYNTVGGWIDQTALVGVISNTVAFLDGRFVVDDQTAPGQFRYTEPYGLAFLPFTFATAEGSPDYTRAVLSDRRELWLFGDHTTEIWWNTGDANNPFQRSQGGFIEVGIAAPYTAKKCDNSIIWLSKNERGGNQVVRAGDGYVPEVISTPEINFRLRELSPLGAYAMTYQMGGHEFYVLYIDFNTLVFDALTKEWHVWRSGTSDYHLAQCIGAYGNGLSNAVLMGLTSADRSLYLLRNTLYTDNSAVINRERVSSHVHDERERLRLASFQVDVESGPLQSVVLDTATDLAAFVAGDPIIAVLSIAGITNGDTVAITMDSGRVHTATITANGASTITFDVALTETVSVGGDVKVYPAETFTLEWSKNGGQTWGTPVTVHMGSPLTKLYRAIVRKLGHARNWTFRLKTATKSKIYILGAYAKPWGDDRDEPG